MQKSILSLIAAIGKNRELGKDNKLLWHIPEDLQHFKKITLGHPVIMGRKTFETLGKPLPKRLNIIVTRNKKYQTKGALVFDSLDKAIDFAKTKSKEVFIIGGGQIYSQAINKADKLYLTLVQASSDADTFFPEYLAFNKIISKEQHQSAGYKYNFLELVKK